MSNYVVQGAKLKCTFGDQESELKIPITHDIYICNKPQANIMDSKPMINILPFGQCSSLANPTVAAATAACQGKLQKMPCIPVIVAPWFVGKPTVLLQNIPAIIDSCKVMCMWAGCISIKDDGQ